MGRLMVNFDDAVEVARMKIDGEITAEEAEQMIDLLAFDEGEQQ